MTLAKITTANSDCAAVKNISSICRWSNSIGPKRPADTMNTTGSMPISRVHWLTLEESSAPMLMPGWAFHANRIATMNSGDSEDAERPARRQQPLGKRLRRDENRHPGTQSQPMRRRMGAEKWTTSHYKQTSAEEPIHSQCAIGFPRAMITISS